MNLLTIFVAGAASDGGGGGGGNMFVEPTRTIESSSSDSSSRIYPAARSWTYLREYNAVPTGDHFDASNYEKCEEKCMDDCVQFAWNQKSGHCFLSKSKELVGEPSDHVLSACITASVTGCAAHAPTYLLPSWRAPQPDPSRPWGGYRHAASTFTSLVHMGNKTMGSYNHNVMFDYSVGNGFFVQWKNCDTDEDCNGQRMLYAQSNDAQNWSPAAVLFPNMTVPGGPAATLEPAPPLRVNGRLYAGASPGFHNTTHDSSAQGSQCCLWPDPLDPRNCGPPSAVAVQYNGTLLLRRVGKGGAPLGPIFWATHLGVPSAFAAASRVHGIKTLAEMDAQTRTDFAMVGATSVKTPCAPKTDGTLKCEACAGGCQIYSGIDWTFRVANERTHWEVPGATDTDVILYRMQDHSLWASTRHNSTDQKAWTLIQSTNIPNDNSNINAGPLPDGRVYLVHNPVTPANGDSWARDPVTVATSRDGYAFDTVAVALSCRNLTGLGNVDPCLPRFDGHAKNPGPSYPQATTVVAPAPENLRAFYVAASNNKEDIWVTRIEYDALL